MYFYIILCIIVNVKHVYKYSKLQTTRTPNLITTIAMFCSMFVKYLH